MDQDVCTPESGTAAEREDLAAAQLYSAPGGFLCSSVFIASSTPNETPCWQLQVTDYCLTSEIKLVLKGDLVVKGAQQSGLSGDARGSSFGWLAEWLIVFPWEDEPCK